MSFLYPSFLIGLLALAIPIIVHLFNFRKAKRIYFSNNRFLMNVKKASSSKLKLKHYLILAARLLFVFFLVMAFAQPFIPPPEENLGSGSAVIYLDNSYSMAGKVGDNISGFDAGLKYLQDILELYPSVTDYKVITNDFEPFSNTYKSVDEIDDLITEMEMTGISREIKDVYNRMISGDTHKNQDDLFIISDFQRSTFGDPSQINIDSISRLYIVPVKMEATSNVMVDSLYLDNPFLVQSEKNTLNMILRNLGETDMDGLLLKLLINGVQTSSAVVNMPAGGKETLEIDLSFKLESVNLCQISIEDYPVTFDNDFYFVLELSNRISVVEIKATDSLTVIQKVYANESLFNFRSFHVRNVDYSVLRSADLVVINEVDELESVISNVLSDYYSDGGSIMVIPSPMMRAGSYQSIIPGLTVIPFSTENKSRLELPDMNNPFYADIFESASEDFNMPEAVQVVRSGAGIRKLLSFRNGETFLAYREGNGRIYLISTPLNDQYTDFHRHAVFVPVLYRMGIVSKKDFNQLYFSIGQNQIVITMDSIDREELIRLKREDQEVIPSQRYIGDKLILEIPRHELTSGLYDLQAGNRYITTLAFNSDKRESVLDQIPENELMQIFREIPFVKIFNTEDIDNFGKELKENYIGKPLWRYALILALIFLLTEVLFIRFL
ncbi:BatA domain-containing protein [Bacteroidota bacterium]